MTSRTFTPQMISQGSESRITVELTGRRPHAIFAAPGLMRNALPPLRSNELLGGDPESSSYVSAIWDA